MFYFYIVLTSTLLNVILLNKGKEGKFLEMYERIKKVRKEYLKLSREEFGKRLGVSMSVITNIELNRLARPEQKEPLIKLICKEFSIDEDWLRYGIGGAEIVFADDFEEDEYTKYAAELGMGENEAFKRAVIEYGKLDPVSRKIIDNFFQKIFDNKGE